MTPETTSRSLFPSALLAVREDVDRLRRNWFWYLLLGIALIVIGFLAMGHSFYQFTAIVTMTFIGFLLLAAGVMYLIGAFYAQGWGGTLLSVLAGLFHLAVGFMVVNHPVAGAVVYALLMAVFFIVEGLFWMVAAIAGGFRHTGWVLLTGIITFLMGIMIWVIWRQSPKDLLWLIALFVGIELIFAGVTYIRVSLAGRVLPEMTAAFKTTE
jgi:uncharacterized membrane protein HdeD (DUF308 family)